MNESGTRNEDHKIYFEMFTIIDTRQGIIVGYSSIVGPSVEE